MHSFLLLGLILFTDLNNFGLTSSIWLIHIVSVTSKDQKEKVCVKGGARNCLMGMSLLQRG